MDSRRECRGIRGATTITTNSAAGIIAATRELLEMMIKVNGVEEADVAGIIFTTTPDLDAQFPAKAARQMGWHTAPLIGAQEMNAAHGLAHCLRILMLWNSERTQAEIQHVYLHGARKLRPDRSSSLNDFLTALSQQIQPGGQQ